VGCRPILVPAPVSVSPRREETKVEQTRCTEAQIVAFNARLRDECLGEHEFWILAPAQLARVHDAQSVRRCALRRRRMRKNRYNVGRPETLTLLLVPEMGASQRKEGRR
jgi:hypothetical protein